MRILVLSPTFLPMVGGAELLILEVFSRLAMHHEIYMVTAEKGLPSGDLDRRINFPVVRYQDKLSLMKIRGHYASGGIIPPFSWSAVTTLRRVIDETRPDVINVHFMVHTGLAAVIAQQKDHIPVVLSLVGRDVPGPRTPRMWKFYHRWTLANVRDVIYITDYCRRAIEGEKSCRGHIIPAGVDLERFRPAQSRAAVRNQMGLCTERPIIFAMQRLSAEKRVDILIRAMPPVLAIHPDALLVIGGKGPALRDLTKLVEELDINAAVRFCGYISEADLPDYYAMADIFAFHSTYETFGIVVAEAMASGTPIVAANTTAIPDVITNNKTGLLVPPLQPQAMAEAIVQLLDSPDLRLRLADAGRRWAATHYNWDQIALQYETVLEQATR